MTSCVMLETIRKGRLAGGSISLGWVWRAYKASLTHFLIFLSTFFVGQNVVSLLLERDVVSQLSAIITRLFLIGAMPAKPQWTLSFWNHIPKWTIFILEGSFCQGIFLSYNQKNKYTHVCMYTYMCVCLHMHFLFYTWKLNNKTRKTQLAQS